MLQVYIIFKIMPKYKSLDNAHNVSHIKYVMKRSVDMAEEYKININMAYCIAAYHDIGMIVGRDRHECYGAEILENDNVIRHFFSNNQVSIMKAAIKEHRAAYNGNFTSIYSNIISEADRSFDIYLMTYRSIAYGIANFPQYTFKQHYYRTYKYLKEKYGKGGYAHMVIYYKPDEGKLEEIQAILENKNEFKLIFNLCYQKYYNDIKK